MQLTIFILHLFFPETSDFVTILILISPTFPQMNCAFAFVLVFVQVFFLLVCAIVIFYFLEKPYKSFNT